MRAMNKNKKLGCLSLLCISPLALAMQPMDDQSLSAMTGQDGLTIGVESNIQFNQLAMIDNDGLTTDYTNRAGLVIAGVAGQSSEAPVKISGLNGSSETMLGIRATIDTDAGTSSNAFVNIGLAFNDSVTGIRISPFSVYAAAANSLSSINGTTYTQNSIFSSGTLLKSDVKEILRLGGIDIVFAANKPTMNIQLGSAPQGDMIRFGGAIDSICGAGDGCNIMLVSDYATSGDATTAPIGASFDFKFTGHNGSPFGLTGFYAGIESANGTNPGGFVFGHAGTTNKFNLQLNNVLLGTNNVQQANVFNNLPNASMGSFGLTGASVTNLRMRVNGL